METNVQIIQTSLTQPIFQKIYEIRGLRVMIDYELAELYGIETKQLNLAVKRNSKRFPSDFMFQLSVKEWNDLLRFQIETLKKQRGQHKKYLPYVFTEQGVAMLSGILNSDRAISVNIAIMRVFVALRRYALNYAELSARLDEFMKTTDGNFSEIFSVLEELTAQKKLYENRKPIGFNVR